MYVMKIPLLFTIYILTTLLILCVPLIDISFFQLVKQFLWFLCLLRLIIKYKYVNEIFILLIAFLFCGIRMSLAPIQFSSLHCQGSPRIFLYMSYGFMSAACTEICGVSVPAGLSGPYIFLLPVRSGGTDFSTWSGFPGEPMPTSKSVLCGGRCDGT